MASKFERHDLRLPLRMRGQLAILSKQLGVSSNTLIVRLIQERLETAELWPPPPDLSKYQPRRKLMPNPHSVFTNQQLGLSEPEITDPEQLKFLEESKALAKQIAAPPYEVPNITDGSAVSYSVNAARELTEALRQDEQQSPIIDKLIYFKRGKDE